MGISKAWRLGGFVAALGASGALIASAAGATGAYFTDSRSGTLTANSGHLTLSNVSGMTMNFADLMPGADQTKTIHYQTNVSSGGVDVWLVFPQDTHAQKEAYDMFTGAKGAPDYADGGLGRYGHFAVSDSNNGLAFQSYNLANDPTPNPANDCPVDAATGRGGSSQQATVANPTPPYCGVPTQILLASNLADGASGDITVTFGLTGKQTQQNQVEFPYSVPFEIVATQHGVAPDAPNI